MITLYLSGPQLLLLAAGATAVLIALGAVCQWVAARRRDGGR